MLGDGVWVEVVTGAGQTVDHESWSSSQTTLSQVQSMKSLEIFLIVFFIHLP